MPSKSTLIASKTASKRRTGGTEQLYIEELIAMDSDGLDEVEDEAYRILRAVRKARSHQRKLERVEKERAKVESSSADNSNDGAYLNEIHFTTEGTTEVNEPYGMWPFGHREAIQGF
jgi:hypothetical protein